MRALTIPVFVLLLIVANVISPAARAQDMALKSGESMDLWPVYWVSNCQSRLVDIAGIDLLDGPPGLTLSLRQQPVLAQRQGCRDPVPGAMVVVGVGTVAAKFDGRVNFRVRYNTLDGARQSTHSIRVALYP